MMAPRAGVFAAAALLALGPAGARTAVAQSSAYEELQTLSSVLNHVRRNYVDSVDYAVLVRAAIEGALGSLDPHSRYVRRAAQSRADSIARGEIAVVGLRLEEVDGAVVVLSVVPGGPAARVGLRPGDRLVMVDDTAVADRTAADLELRLAGPAGSRVALTIERGGRLEPARFRVVLKRALLPTRSVTVARMADSITAYVRLAELGREAGREVRAALHHLRHQGATRAILDLRGNPGGLVAAAVDVAAEFLPRNTLVFRTRGRISDANQDFVTERAGDFVALPLILLIDEGSASAAEALAAALQDHDRALLAGRRTFGKALVQKPMLLRNGDVVVLAIGRVVSPSGRIIQRRFQGLRAEQYNALAGSAGAAEDTLVEYRTAGGRIVRAGGGIAPDEQLPPPPPLPAWWCEVAAFGLVEAVADSVAHALPADATLPGWIARPAEWRARLLPPFLARVRSRLGIEARVEAAVEAAMARMLATRVAHVRWGADAGAAFELATDAEAAAAIALFGGMQSRLAARR